MGTPAYLIAKHVSDLFRNEPTNIGVLVWMDGEFEARFLAESYDGKINGNKVPRRIQSSTYKQWVASWRALIRKEFIRSKATNLMVPRTDRAFLEALQQTGKGNYILEQGGEVLEDVPPHDLPHVADYLFERLVGEPEVNPSLSAEEVRDGVLEEAGVISEPFVKRDFKVECQIDSGVVHPEFHVYIGNGAPLCLIQVIPFTNQPRSIKQASESVAHRFGHVIKANVLPANGRAIALIYDPDQRQDELIEESKTELKSNAQILDLVRDKKKTLDLISETVRALNESH